MKSSNLLSVAVCLLSVHSVSALDLPPYTLPATIGGHTFQEGAITLYDDGSYSVSYYNRNSLYPNPTHYAPYGRWDIWWSEKVTCTGNDFENDTSCTWNYVDAHDPWNWEQYANLGHTGVNDIIDVDGHVYSSMDIRNTDSTLSYQGTVYKAANWGFSHHLTVTVEPSAGGTIASSPTSDFSCTNGTCQGNFSGSVSLTATPDEDCIFAYWNDGTITSSDNPLTVNMSGNKTLDAVFICSLQWSLTGSIESRTILLGFSDNWQYGECPSGTDKLHAGVDVNANASEAVYAAYDGVVKAIFTDQHSTWADAIVLEHDISSNKFTTVYWHVAAYGGLGVNDSVTKGDQIATVANLGSNTHFHFGIRLGAYNATNSLVGALPTTNCGTSPQYPAFPERFIDPENAPYE